MMYPMVRQHRHQNQQQQQQLHHPQIQQLDQSPDDIEEELGKETQRSRKPLYRRFISYVREAWTGVKFAL
ncbi:hypothetical protein WA026_007384, partial [Henosepilachna vigintioctopunctata]